MKNLVFLLEEPSAKDLLEGLLPRLLPEGWAVYYLVFDGKQDLEKQIVRELRKFIPDYQKRDGARRLGGLLDPARNQSSSFRAFCAGVQRLITTSAA